MDRYVVVGHPVEHSQSPFIHAAFARQTGQALAYDRLLCPLDGFADDVRRFAASDPANPARGCNVTVPFKFEAFALAPRHTPRAALAQAANTLRFDAEGWLADNTDGAGLVRDLTVNAGALLAGRRVLLIGAGGAAAGVLGPLLEAGPGELVLANRTPEKAHALARRHRDAVGGAALRVRPLDDCGAAFDVVINGTASSLHGGALPVGLQVFGPGTLAIDLMYGTPARAFLDIAAAQGALTRDGLGMLVEQAAESFALWRGMRPDTAEVLAALRARVSA